MKGSSLVKAGNVSATYPVDHHHSRTGFSHSGPESYCSESFRYPLVSTQLNHPSIHPVYMVLILEGSPRIRYL